MILTRFTSKGRLERQHRARAARVTAASSADVEAIEMAIGILENAIYSIFEHYGRAYNLTQSAIDHLVLQLRDARLWRNGEL